MIPLGFPGGSDGKASAYNVEDPGSIPGLGRSSGEGNGAPLQYSCLENPMHGGAWWAAVHGVAKSQTRLSSFPFPFRIAADGDCGREIQRCLLLGRKAMANPDRVLKLCLVLILDVALDSTRDITYKGPYSQSCDFFQ